MALPTHLQKTFTPQEIEFITESERVTIYPQYTSKSLELITDKIPNMIAGHRMQVPLWYALALKKQSKCRIFPPDWLSEEQLEEFLKQERQNASAFTNLPFNWLELAKIFFTYAVDDFESLEVVPKLKQLIIDLKEVRAIKVHSGLKAIDEHYLQVDNLSRMEINEIRPFVSDVMGKYIKLKNTVVEEEDDDAMEEEDELAAAAAAAAEDVMGYEDDSYQYNYNQ